MNNKPVFNLTQEEQAIEDALERGDEETRPVTDEERAELAHVARNTLAKNKVLTIRISARDLTRLKEKAAREGLSYQTYLSSLIHKNV